MGNKVLITGAAGFVGASLIEALLNDSQCPFDSICGIDLDRSGAPSNLRTLITDLDACHSMPVALLDRGDTVIHLAAIAPLPDNQCNPQSSMRNNVESLANMLEHARLRGVSKFIFMSSGAVYENNRDLPFQEDNIVNPTLIYPTSKYIGETLCKTFADCYEMSIDVIRLFNLYGPYQAYERKQPPLIGYLIKNMLLNGDVVLYQNNPNIKRDYIYIEDLTELLATLCRDTTPGFRLINACSGVNTSVQEIADTIANLVGFDPSRISYAKKRMYWDRYSELFAGHYPLSRKIVESEVDKITLGSVKVLRQFIDVDAMTPLTDGLEACVEYAKEKFS